MVDWVLVKTLRASNQVAAACQGNRKKAPHSTRKPPSAAAYPPFQQNPIGYGDELAITAQQQRFDSADFLDLPFDIFEGDMLSHLVKLAHVDPGKDLADKLTTTEPECQSHCQPYRDQHDGNT